MSDRPYVVLSACVSLDGHLDSPGPDRLVLSGAEDLDRVDAVRAGCDAVLVGAGTVRMDRPRLVVRDPGRRAARVARGVPETPVKVTVTEGADLDPDAPFFTTGGEKLVLCPSAVVGRARRRLGGRATVLDGGDRVSMEGVARALDARGITRLLVEGGRSVLTQCLVEGVADELHLALAPVFVGAGTGPRFVGGGAFAWDAARRARLVGVAAVGDVVVSRYALSERCEEPEVGRVP
ncbi:RibD family protein [Phycicoccus avicenniae]|uniref:RibD family protein n=1 Tax=Phycicoccus avicenniae TaxID=2828860 RepID=UPI003D27E168